MSNLNLSTFVKNIAKRNNIKLGTIYGPNNNSFKEQDLITTRLRYGTKQPYTPENTLQAINTYLKDKESES